MNSSRLLISRQSRCLFGRSWAAAHHHPGSRIVVARPSSSASTKTAQPPAASAATATAILLTTALLYSSIINNDNASNNNHHESSSAAAACSAPPRQLLGAEPTMLSPATEPKTGILFPRLCNGMTFVGCGVRVKYGFVKVSRIIQYNINNGKNKSVLFLLPSSSLYRSKE
jgi:hypothetical protein